jgi:hypothetical protein
MTDMRNENGNKPSFAEGFFGLADKIADRMYIRKVQSDANKRGRRALITTAVVTAAGAALSTCVSPPTEAPKTPVPTATPAKPETSTPVVDLTAEAAKKTTLNTNLTNLIPENGVFTQGIGGEISGFFGDPKITGPLSSLQIDAARAMLGRISPGTLYAVPNGKAVIQRLTGVKDGVDYSNKPDAEVPFKVTVTMLPNTFLQKDGEYIILPQETKPGEARYIRTKDQTKWNVTTSFLVEPGFLPTGAALWWDAASLGMQPVIWDGNGNPRLMGNLQVEVKPVVVPTPDPTATAVPTEIPISTEVPQPATIKFELTDGTTLEMPQFQTAEEALTYVEKNTLWWTGNAAVRSTVGHTWEKVETPEDSTFFDHTSKLPGIDGVYGPEILFTFPEAGDSFFPMGVYKVEGKTLLVFRNNAKQYEVVCVDMDSTEFAPWLSGFSYSTPTPQP